MAINTETLYRKLYDNLMSKGYNPTAEDATTGKEVVPEEADFLTFDVEMGKGSTPVTLTVEKNNDSFGLTVYFTDEAKENATDDWYNILKDLRYTARSSGIKKFIQRNRNHLGPDMQKRTYMKKQEQLAEGYYPMGRKASYNDAIPSVKIVIEHTRQIEEGEQRFRNVNRIFLENEQGERILAPTKLPGIAKVYARVIAEGDLPHGERWNHINGLVEEYSKMAGFVRATKNKQFNESAQKLVESGIAHYQSLRETLSRMIGRKGYNTYFESWTPPLMEDETDTSNLNELFVQETLDPRIESVMPILSKLQKNISEMSEVSELAEWADSLLEGGDGGEASEEPVEQIEEAPGAETLKHNQDTEEKNLKAFGLAEEESLTSNNPVGIPEDDLDESALQAYLGNKKYGEKGMDALRKAGREHASKETMAKIRAKYDKLDEVEMDEAANAAQQAAIAIAMKDKGQKPKELNEVPDTQFHEDVDTGEADARKTVPSGEKGDWDKNFRERLKQFKQETEKEKVEEDEFAGDYATGPAGQWRNKGPKANKPAKVGDLVGASESFESDLEAITESEGRPYVCVHAKKGQCEVTANSSYEAAQKAAKKWGLKSTAGIDCHLADTEKDPASLEEGTYSKDVERAFPGGKASGVKTGANAPKGTSTMPKDKEKAKGKPVAEGQEDLDAIKRLMNEGWKGTLAGSAAGGIAGELAGGPIGSIIGGAIGGKIGDELGGQDVKEEQLNEFGPLIAAGARALIPLLARVGPALSKAASSAGRAAAPAAAQAGKAAIQGTGQVAKAGAEIAAKNAPAIGTGIGAYTAITDIAKSIPGGIGQVYDDVSGAAAELSKTIGDAVDSKTITELAAAAVKYALPVGIVIALLYGGKKLIDKVVDEGADDTVAGVVGQAVGLATPNPSDFKAGFKKQFEGVNEAQDDLDAILRLIK